jgi:hypothetical protein
MGNLCAAAQLLSYGRRIKPLLVFGAADGNAESFSKRPSVQHEYSIVTPGYLYATDRFWDTSFSKFCLLFEYAGPFQ